MSYTYPKGIQHTEGEFIELDVGQNSLLTVMTDYTSMFFYLKQTVKKAGVDTLQIRSATFPKNGSVPSQYHALKWEYFGQEDSLIVNNGNIIVIFKVAAPKDPLSKGIQQMNEVSYQMLKGEVQKQQLVSETKYGHFKSAFEEIQLNTDVTDFKITCKDGTSVNVHTAVLSTFWPFFKGLMSNECIEKTEKTLHLNFSSDWVKLMVSHIYKQPLTLTFDEATGMVLLSNMYLLPELGEIASEQIHSLVTEETTLEDLLIGWERSREASNEELKKFFAKKIAKKNPMESTEMFKGWEEVKLLELYFDTVKVV